jgi:hypothetical protein
VLSISNALFSLAQLLSKPKALISSQILSARRIFCRIKSTAGLAFATKHTSVAGRLLAAEIDLIEKQFIIHALTNSVTHV